MSLSINCLYNKPFTLIIVCLIILSGCAEKKAKVPILVVAENPAYRIPSKVAVLPLENLSGKKAPFKEIEKSLADRLVMMGVNVFKDEAKEKFMIHHRMRYMGGINADIAQAFNEEEQVKAVLITSLELYQEEYPPKIGIISRLVSTGSQPAILWMDSIGVAGDDSPGILGLGLIEDPMDLMDKALDLLSQSLDEFFAGKGTMKGGIKGRRKYGPKTYYLSTFIESGIKSGKTYTVAPLPFYNISERKNAGNIVMLHLVNALAHEKNFIVLEPGLIRNQLLHARVIMPEGVSLSDAHYVANSLEADLTLAGEVTDYQDIMEEGGNPVVNFYVIAIEKTSRRVVWSSESRNKGNDEVLFFDAGKLNTSNVLAAEMARSVASKMSGTGYLEDEQENVTRFNDLN